MEYVRDMRFYDYEAAYIIIRMQSLYYDRRVAEHLDDDEELVKIVAYEKYLQTELARIQCKQRDLCILVNELTGCVIYLMPFDTFFTKYFDTLPNELVYPEIARKFQSMDVISAYVYEWMIGKYKEMRIILETIKQVEKEILEVKKARCTYVFNNDVRPISELFEFEERIRYLSQRVNDLMNGYVQTEQTVIMEEQKMRDYQTKHMIKYDREHCNIICPTSV